MKSWKLKGSGFGSVKSDFRFESFIRKLRNIPLVYNLLIHGCPEKDGENYPEKAFEQRNKETQID